MPFAGNLRTLPLPDVFQTLNNIKATGVLRLRSNAGSRDVVFQQGEIIGVGFLDKSGREELELRLTLLGVDQQPGERLKGVTWYWTAMQTREHTARAEMDELVHEQAREQLHNLFAWNQAEFAFDEAGPGKSVANELVARSLERPLSIDTATLLLEAAKQQDEWAELRSRIREEAGMAAMGSSPSLAMQEQAADPAKTADGFETQYHLYLDGEWRGPYPREQIVSLVQAGEVAPETWSYDPLTQERRTLDDLLGGEARRITPDELDTLRQAVKAAEARLAEERAGREADLAELRGLASEALRLAHDCQFSDPAIAAVVERLSEVVNGDDPSIVALAAETVIVATVRHLRELGEQGLAAARAEAEALAARIAEAERDAAAERGRFEAQIAEAEGRTDAEREAAEALRRSLAEAAEDAAHLNQELERARRDHSRASTARIGSGRPADEGPARLPELERELGRMRAEHARLLSEVANLQARIDEDRARHQSELEATRALAGSVARADPPTETIGKATESIDRPATDIFARGEAGPAPDPNQALVEEVRRLQERLAEAERRADGSGARRAAEQHERLAGERDAAQRELERLRRELEQAREEAARAGGEAQARLQAAELRAAQAEARLATNEALLRQAEEALGEARIRAERAEEALRDQERSAYEAARANTQMQVRMRELAARLEEGEARLGELGDLSAQLAEARARAATLEDEGARFRADLAAVRDAATGRLERSRRRIAELRARLRAAKRDRSAAVPWSSPMTATFAAAPAQAQAAVPWPSPATAAFAAPGQAAAWPPPAAAVAQPGAGELPDRTTLRTTSGTFVPMPMPEDSSAARPRVQPAAAPPSPALPAPAAPPRRARRWGLAAAAALVLAAAWLWHGISTAVPICEQAIVNGALREVGGRIAGQLQLAEGVREGAWVRAGDHLGTLRNTELDPFVLSGLQDRLRQAQARILASEASQRQVQAQLDQSARRLAEEPASPEAPALARLRDEFAIRLAELSGSLDDLRARRADLERDVAQEERRLAELREAPLTSPVDGLVWSVASTAEAHPAGRPLLVIVDAASLVIDAAVPDRQAISVGDRAEVRLASGTCVARVSAVDAAARLAQALPAAPGTRRVLLTVDNPRALDRELSRSARIAFTGPDPGLLARLAVRLRF